MNKIQVIAIHVDGDIGATAHRRQVQTAGSISALLKIAPAASKKQLGGINILRKTTGFRRQEPKSKEV